MADIKTAPISELEKHKFRGTFDNPSISVVNPDGSYLLSNATISLTAADIQIGAVEIKNGSSDQRATVNSDGELLVDASGADVPISDSRTAFSHGAKSSVGTSAVQIVSASTPAIHGVEVKAASTNTAKIFVGGATVTANAADSTDGYELGANESMLIKVNNANKIYVISSGTGQKVFWVCV